jgi:uncharacterized protein YcfJ
MQCHKEIVMNTASRLFISALLAGLTAGTASASHGDDGSFIADARVTHVQPVTRIVEVTTPRQVCWQEQVAYAPARPRSHTSTIFGAILGGVAGNAFGSGRGNTLMTAGGALLGASIGRDAAMRRQPATYGTEQRCEIEETVTQEERLDGYDVTYEYQGQSFVTRTQEDPGERIRVRVQVQPLPYNL